MLILPPEKKRKIGSKEPENRQNLSFAIPSEINLSYQCPMSPAVRCPKVFPYPKREYAVDEKARFYRMAKRSATECAGILDVCQRLQLVEEKRYTKGRELLIRIVSMLVRMAQRSH